MCRERLSKSGWREEDWRKKGKKRRWEQGGQSINIYTSFLSEKKRETMWMSDCDEDDSPWRQKQTNVYSVEYRGRTDLHGYMLQQWRCNRTC